MTIDTKSPAPDEEAEELIQYEVRDKVAIITLNRPTKLNAFTDTMVIELMQALRRFDIDPDAWVAVIRGNGRAFSSGADVRQRQMRSREEFEKLGGRPSALNARGEHLLVHAANWKPVITAPHGLAIGMGLGLCLNSDLIVAEEGTRFQVTETRRGLSGARYYELMKFRGAGPLALELSLTGRFFTAEESLQMGLINRVAPKGRALEAAMELAAEINKNPPLGVRSTIRTRRYFMEKLEHEIHFYTNALRLALTEDFAESARAFAEKREPAPFKGR